ncbi:hypothetical protein AAEX63_09930 [Luteococcus sp. H138]|uniref:hypothetical protein n=1 Tax=unclassified Luteococcus TaxID=2639923 RepID=UPI00313E802E
MNTKVLIPFAATFALATAVAATPAQAAGAVSVTSPSCGTIRMTNTSSVTMLVEFDSGNLEWVPAHSSKNLRGRSGTGMPGGSYSWLSGTSRSQFTAPAGYVTVKRCAGGATRPVDGDQNGDGKADVLGITTTGDLYYYRMTNTTLANGIKAGHGWSSMVFMQQVNEIEGGPSGNYLIAVRKDGTVWRYDNKGYGKFANGRQIGQGLAEFSNFTITKTTDPLSFGEHVLLATSGDDLHFMPLNRDSIMDPMHLDSGWADTVSLMALRDFDNDNLGDLIAIRSDGTMWSHTVAGDKRVGTGWGAMQTVSSPGSLDGDKLSDLIARRSDGNLYKYINRGGRWAEGVQIGRRWNGIRLLA